MSVNNPVGKDGVAIDPLFDVPNYTAPTSATTQTTSAPTVASTYTQIS